MELRDYPRRYEKTIVVDAAPNALFAALDDHRRLAGHMMDTSLMMAGQAMRFQLDQNRGRAIGSKITMSGRVLGLDLLVEEVVIDRSPPRSKVWETVGEPRLVVIGHYRMGFKIEPDEAGSLLTVFIAYCLPSGLLAVPALLFGPIYARWCVKKMAAGAAQLFVPEHCASGTRPQAGCPH